MIWRLLQSRKQRPPSPQEPSAGATLPPVSWWRGRSVVEAGRLLEDARAAMEGKKTSAQAEALRPYLEKAAFFTGAIDELELKERRANLIFKKDFGPFEIALVFASFEPRQRPQLEPLAPGQIVTIIGQVERIQFSKLDLTHCELLEPRQLQDEGAGGRTGPAPVLPHERPRVLLCASESQLSLAEKLQEELDPLADCALWQQGALSLSHDALAHLVSGARESDFSIVLAGAEGAADEALFQLGLLVGALGPGRAFLVHRQGSPPALPSGLAGVTVVPLPASEGGEGRAGLGALRDRLEAAMKAMTA